jgi:hypothetical protein
VHDCWKITPLHTIAASGAATRAGTARLRNATYSATAAATTVACISTTPLAIGSAPARISRPWLTNSSGM